MSRRPVICFLSVEQWLFSQVPFSSFGEFLILTCIFAAGSVEEYSKDIYKAGVD